MFAAWIIAGLTGVIVRDIYSYFAKEIGLAKFYIWNIGASLLVKIPEIKTVWGTALGLLVDLITGALLGILFGLLIRWSGSKNYIIKGWGVGLIAWLFLYGIVYHNLPYTKPSAPSDALSNISAFIGHSIFGITMALVYIKIFSKRFADADELDMNDNN